MAYAAYRVDLIEYERGWGSRVEDSIYFATEDEAKDWAHDYNETHNTETTVPDWYMVADSSTSFVEITKAQHTKLLKKGKLWKDEL